MAGSASSGADARVSVLIPTYNRADLLGEAIDSVLAQSYTDYEIIVIDDGSTDDTRAVLARYGTRVRCIHAPHVGVVRARNLGFEAARGEYLCILDSDDLYYPHKLALQVEHLDAHPDTVMVYTEFSGFDARGFWDEFHLRSYHRSAYGGGKRGYQTLFGESRPLAASAVLRATVGTDAKRAHWLERSQFQGELFPAYLFDTVVFTNSMMFRRSLLARIGLQDAYFGHFHDLEFALRICKAGRVAFLDNPTYKLRYHHGQVSNARADGGLNRVKLQRGLLRVARVHGLEDAAFYSAHRAPVDALIARLCRAAAIPLVAYGGANRHWRKYFPRRARRYLAWCARHGSSQRLLLLVSYLPSFAKRVYFALAERLARRPAATLPVST